MRTQLKTAWLALLVLLAGCGESPAAIQPSPTSSKTGSLADTWSWNSTGWHRVAGTGPAARYSASLAYDARHNVYLLFGGQTVNGSSDETWTWDGSRWKALSPLHKPPPRRGAAMAYDPAQQVVVLYGGHVPDAAEGHPSADTWTWDGSDWMQADDGPGPRHGPVAVTAQGRAIFFGGNYANTMYYGDAWSFSGKKWIRADAGAQPPGRGNAAAVWDAVDSSLLIYGGTGLNAAGGPGAQGVPLSDTWSLANGSWSALSRSGPGHLSFANAIWDAPGKRAIVLLGMPCPDPSGAAWAWDGKAWSQLANPGIPARWGAALAQAPDGKALLFGGSNEKGC